MRHVVSLGSRNNQAISRVCPQVSGHLKYLSRFAVERSVDKLRTLASRPQPLWSAHDWLFFVHRHPWWPPLRGRRGATSKATPGDFFYSALFSFQGTEPGRAPQHLQGAIRVVGYQRVGTQVEQATHGRLLVDGPQLHVEAPRLGIL